MQGELTKEQEVALDQLADKMVEPDSEQVKSELDEIQTQTPPEESPSEEPEQEEEEPKEEDKAKKNGYASRIDHLTRLRREAEERELRALEELESLKRVQAGSPQDPAPKQEQFEDYAEFVRATARWEGRQIVNQELNRQKEASLQQFSQQRASAQQQFEDSRMEEGNLAFPGQFESQAKLLSRIVNPQQAAYHALFESEQFPDLVMYLASNLNEAVRITGLSPRAQLREIIRLEDTISHNPQEQPAPVQQPPAQNSPLVSRRISQAPAPPRIVGGGKETRSNRNESMNDYAERRLAELRKRRR